jgi:hypothetical protein
MREFYQRIHSVPRRSQLVARCIPNNDACTSTIVYERNKKKRITCRIRSDIASNRIYCHSNRSEKFSDTSSDRRCQRRAELCAIDENAYSQPLGWANGQSLGWANGNNQLESIHCFDIFAHLNAYRGTYFGIDAIENARGQPLGRGNCNNQQQSVHCFVNFANLDAYHGTYFGTDADAKQLPDGQTHRAYFGTDGTDSPAEQLSDGQTHPKANTQASGDTLRLSGSVQTTKGILQLQSEFAIWSPQMEEYQCCSDRRVQVLG